MFFLYIVYYFTVSRPFAPYFWNTPAGIRYLAVGVSPCRYNVAMTEYNPIIDLSWEAARTANHTFNAVQAANFGLDRLNRLDHTGFSEAAWSGLASEIEQRRTTKMEEFEILTSIAAPAMILVDSPFGREKVHAAKEPRELRQLNYRNDDYFGRPNPVEPTAKPLQERLDDPLTLIGSLEGSSHNALDWITNYSARAVLAMGKDIVIDARPRLGSKAKNIIAASIDALDAPYSWKKTPTMGDIAEICPTLDKVPAECLRNDLKVDVTGASVLDIVLLRPQEVFSGSYGAAQLRMTSYASLGPVNPYRYGDYKPNPVLGAELVQQAQTFALKFFEEKV